MFSSSFRRIFGTNCGSFAAQPRSVGHDSRYSAVAISFRRLLCSFVSLALLPASAVAQAAATSERSPVAARSQPCGGEVKVTCSSTINSAQSIHVDVDLALVNVTFTDPYDRPVTGLDSSSFRVFENNVEQEVVTSSSEDIPVSVGIIFEDREVPRGCYRFSEDIQSRRRILFRKL